MNENIEPVEVEVTEKMGETANPPPNIMETINELVDSVDLGTMDDENMDDESMDDESMDDKIMEDENIFYIIMAVILFILSMIIHNSKTYDIVGSFGSKIPQLKPFFKGNLLVGIHSLLLTVIFYLILKYFPDHIIIDKLTL